MLETIVTVYTWLSANPIVGVPFIIFLIYYVVHNFEDGFNAIHDIRKEYANRTFSYMEMVINSIITISYTRMVDATTNIVVSCPNNNNTTCSFSEEDINQQKLIYRFLLRDIFLIGVKNKVKEFIMENGFHDFVDDEERLNNYINEKGKYIYYYVLDELKERAKDGMPDLIPYIGKNFSEEEAIEAYRSIIKNALSNEDLRDAKIKEYRAKHGIASKFRTFNRVLNALKKD